MRLIRTGTRDCPVSPTQRSKSTRNCRDLTVAASSCQLAISSDFLLFVSVDKCSVLELRKQVCPSLGPGPHKRAVRKFEPRPELAVAGTS
jgi:hypothetical protein